MSSRADDIWYRLADAETRTTLQSLPADLRARAASLPILFEDRPSRALREDGWPDDLLGLFEGPAYGEAAAAADFTPPAIRLFVGNLRAETGDDPAAFRQEVRTTLLHEIGHYLGLDEDDLAARQLD
jgi:predicted Zn-dependent protease with MMP-like domain